MKVSEGDKVVTLTTVKHIDSDEQETDESGNGAQEAESEKTEE